MLKKKKQTKTLKKNKASFLDLNFIIQKEIKQRSKIKKLIAIGLKLLVNIKYLYYKRNI